MSLFNPSFYYEKVIDIDIPFLKKNNIECILLDIDDTIAQHDSPVLVPGFKLWLKEVLNNNIKVVLVSNNYKNRVQFIAKRLDLPFIYSSFKPTPLGIIRALKMVGSDKNKSILIGDQIFTDILGANMYRIKSILVDPVSIKRSFISRIKRWAERPIRKNLKKNKDCGNE